MRKIVFLFATLLLIGGLSSCEKILELLTFTVSDSQSLTIPATMPFGQLLPLTPVTVQSTSQDTYANNNTKAEYVQDVTLEQLTLTITSPAGQNFDFLRRIEVYISSDANGGNAQLLASLNPVPAGLTSLQLTPTNARLDAYLKASSYTLTTKVELARPLGQNTTVRADSRFKVTANPL